MNWGIILPLIVFLILMFASGFMANKYVSNSKSFVKEYFLGSRDLSGFILAMTMMATYGSASSFIGGPGVAYSQGLGWVLLSMAQLPAGYFVLLILGKKFAIVARKYDSITLIDFLKSRYKSNWVGILSAISIVIFLFSSMAAQWVGGAVLIESITGISYVTSLVIFAISVLIYVIVGGYRAVAFADTFLGIVMFLGTLILFAATIIAGGGVENIMTTLAQDNPKLLTPFGADGSLTPLYVTSFWILVGVGVVGLPQITVRAMSYKDSKSMHQALIIGTVFVGIIMLGMHLIGVFAKAILPGIEVGNEVMPEVTQHVLPDFLAGIVLAAPFAAIMSTVNSLLILVSSTIVKDLYLSFIKPEANEGQIKTVSFTMTAIIGIVVFFMSLSPPDFLIWLNLFAFGGLEAAFIWPVVLGLYWKKGNKYGAIFSTLTGVISYIYIDTYYPSLFGMHSVVLPVIISLIAYIIVSQVTSKIQQLN